MPELEGKELEKIRASEDYINLKQFINLNCFICSEKFTEKYIIRELQKPEKKRRADKAIY